MVADGARIGANKMAEEMAARWWGKKDLGEARLSPYTVESCPLAKNSNYFASKYKNR